MNVEETETVADGGPADSVVTSTAHQPGVERPAPAPTITALMNQPTRTVPAHSNVAQPNVTKCYAGLKELVELEARLGFLDADTAGKKWMIELNSILFHSSPFHSKTAARGFAVPEEFKFANDVKVCNGQAAPRMSANEMQQLMGSSSWASSQLF